MVATQKKFIATAVASAVLASQVQAVSNYQTTSLFDQPGCYSQPMLILSSVNPNCEAYPQIAAGTCVLNSSSTTQFKMYDAYQQNCLLNSTTGMNLANKVSNYVAVAQYSANDCSGDVVSNTAYIADALCHPGASSGSFQMNCNGGSPILTTCSDLNCRQNCYNTTYGVQNTCNWGGVMATCVNAASKKPTTNSGSGTSGTSNNNDDSSTDGDSNNAFSSSGQFLMLTSSIVGTVLVSYIL